MNLIQQLSHGTMDGERLNPPNNLMLQAAAALGQLDAINATNNILVQQLQFSEAQNLELITVLRTQLEEATKESNQLKEQQKVLYGTIYDYESVRKSEREVADVGVGDAGRTASAGVDTIGEISTEAPISVSNKADYFAGSVNDTNS